MGKRRNGTWSTGKRLTRGISMSPALARRLDETVAKAGIRRSEFVRSLIVNWLALHEGRPTS